MVISSAQLRAARVLLGLSQEDVAVAASVSLPTLKRAEADTGPRVSSGTVDSIRSVLETRGAIFIEPDHTRLDGGAGVRLQPEIVQIPAAAVQGRRHLRGKTIIGTQREWELVRPATGDDRAMRAFLREFGFNPDVQIKQGAESLDKALKPRSKTIRRQIFDHCFKPGWTVEKVNREAREIGKTSVRTDADVFFGLFSGYVRLP